MINRFHSPAAAQPAIRGHARRVDDSPTHTAADVDAAGAAVEAWQAAAVAAVASRRQRRKEEASIGV